MDINQITVCGRLGADIEFKSTANGTTLAVASIATNNRRKQPDGSYSEDTTWHKVNIWAKGLVELLGKREITKGDIAYAQGRLKFRTMPKPPSRSQQNASTASNNHNPLPVETVSWD